MEETRNRMQRLQEQIKGARGKASGLKCQVTALFRDIREQLEIIEKSVLSEITRQEDQIILQLSDEIQQLEIQTGEIFGKMLHIEDLCNSKDHTTHNDNGERNNNMDNTLYDLDEILISVTLQRGFNKLAEFLTHLKSRKGFHVGYASDILLDKNTAACDIVISSDLKTVSYSAAKQSRPQRPERFATGQVLSTQCFSSGQHYWEVETSDLGYWKVGVAYPSIKRETSGSYIGCNNKSWCLCCWTSKCLTAEYESKWKYFRMKSACKALGIYLDYEAGLLSFYHLADTISLIHTFTATFTEPLYASFSVCNDGWVKIRGS
ncbi:zinc finger protein RFP-like [Ascaphus truei]|uniref:zinc finger protein RFP-like n=1 Tax=Ascaphus truei TaxID=8439 RepID=UPI003F59A330